MRIDWKCGGALTKANTQLDVPSRTRRYSCAVSARIDTRLTDQQDLREVLELIRPVCSLSARSRSVSPRTDQCTDHDWPEGWMRANDELGRNLRTRSDRQGRPSRRTPKLDEVPRMAKKSSGSSVAEQRLIVPSASTIVAAMTLSTPRP